MPKKRIAWLAVFFTVLLFAQSDERWNEQLRKYAAIFSLVNDNFPEPVNKEKTVYASISGLLQDLDPHSYFLDPVALRAMFEDQRGNYYGIGIRITKYEDRLTVVAPLRGTPADRLGILAGDVISEINGEKTKTMLLETAMSKLRGAKDSTVTIKILRAGLSETLTFTIQRAEIPLNSVSYALIHPDDPRIGFISIRTFGGTTTREFQTSLDRLLRDDVKGLILDLRGNPGGALEAAIEISDFFLPRGDVVVSIRGRRMNVVRQAEQDHQYEGLPLVILINRGSASASEIVAAALQDHGRAEVVGVRSWGKGLVETLHRLSLNCAVALTTAKYYTPSGKCLQRDFSKLDDYFFFFDEGSYDTDRTIPGGVIPDVVVRPDEYSPLLVTFISRGLFFSFVRTLLESRYPVAGPDFQADAAVCERFRQFLAERKVTVDGAEFERQLPDIAFEIEREVVSQRFSDDEGVKLGLQKDLQTKKAVEILQKQLKESSLP